MAEEIEDSILEDLRRRDAKLDRIVEDISDIKVIMDRIVARKVVR